MKRERLPSERNIEVKKAIQRLGNQQQAIQFLLSKKREDKVPDFLWKRGEESVVMKLLVFEEFLSPQQFCHLIVRTVRWSCFHSFFFRRSFLFRFGFVSGSVECEREKQSASARESCGFVSKLFNSNNEKKKNQGKHVVECLQLLIYFSF
jgi:hypothetical protein